MTEVEIRAFLDQTQYQQLLSYLTSDSAEVLHTKQVTYYLDCDTDTRVQLSQHSGKVWQKSGQIHDASRVEIQADMSRDAAAAMLNIFEKMGYDIKVKWFRERRKFRLREFTVCLDHTVGYGMILEAELLCEEEPLMIDQAKRLLAGLFDELNISITPPELFNKAFNNYLEEWEVRTDNLTLDWLDS